MAFLVLTQDSHARPNTSEQNLSFTTFILKVANLSSLMKILDLNKIFAEDQKGLENFVGELVGQVLIHTQNMSFPDLLILMSRRKGARSTLHPVRDLFKVGQL